MKNSISKIIINFLWYFFISLKYIYLDYILFCLYYKNIQLLYFLKS